MTEQVYKMPPMTDNRTSLRFTQNEEKTYKVLVDLAIPEWRREFVRMMWYGRVPLTVWNDLFLRLSNQQALKLLHTNKGLEIDDTTVQLAKYLTQVVSLLISRGVLPCTDTKALPAVFQLGVELLALQQQQPQPEQERVETAVEEYQTVEG